MKSLCFKLDFAMFCNVFKLFKFQTGMKPQLNHPNNRTVDNLSSWFNWL